MATLPARAFRDAPNVSGFLLVHKGDLTLLFSFLAFIACWAALMFTRWHTPAEIGVSIAEAALIGGLCDYIALKMIFERRWYLPGSGVLPRNRERLIEGIAATIENEWLTPQMIGRELGKMDLVGRLGTYVEEVKVDDLMGEAGLERLINRTIEFLESPEDRVKLEAALRRALPKTFTRIYRLVERLGAQSLTERIAENLRRRLPQLRQDPNLIATIEGAVHEFGAGLRDSESYPHQLASRLIDQVVRRAVDASRGQISRMVREELAQLSTEQIRIQIESKTRTHLDWIRVNGGIFGAFFGLLFALTRIAASHGPQIFARLGFGM